MIEVERLKLKEALELVSVVARPDASNPVYQTATILAADGRLTFEAQGDHEIARTSCEAKITGDVGKLARFAIKPASLLARIGTVNTENVRIDAEKKGDGFMVRVRAGTACWRLDPSEPGEFPSDLPTELAPIDGAAVAAAFSRVQWAANEDTSRPEFNGIIVVPGFAMATNGSGRAARVALEHAQAEHFIAPLCLAKMVTSKAEAVRSLGITSRYIAIEFGVSLYASRRPWNSPPALAPIFAKVLGDAVAYECRVAAKDLGSAVVAATVGGRESKDVEIESVDGNIIVRTPKGDLASAKCDGIAPSMSVQVDQLKGALSGVTDGTAILRRASAKTEPLTIHQEDGSYVALLMPMAAEVAKAAKPKEAA